MNLQAKKKEFTIRQSVAADESFLWEMLYQTMLSEPDADELNRETLKEPLIARYVENWGLPGDLGFIAESESEEFPLGAVWSRLSTEAGPGYGFVNNETPEIAIATTEAARGMGVGTALLEEMIRSARLEFPALSLSVAPGNPARRLYERFGFKEVGEQDGHPLMLLSFEEDQP